VVIISFPNTTAFTESLESEIAKESESPLGNMIPPYIVQSFEPYDPQSTPGHYYPHFPIPTNNPYNTLTPDPNSSKFFILVMPSIYQSIEPEVGRYMDDLIVDDYYPLLYTMGWGNEIAVRNLLKYGFGLNMVGAVFVGDIPIAWYEIENDYGHENNHAEFPIELYFMDLDGTWLDNDMDGIYDAHISGSGDLEPEIWVGRLRASRLHIPNESEISLIKNYFDKNHIYRTNQMDLNKRALVYIDDDWVYWSKAWKDAVGLLYEDKTLVKKKGVTTADDYRSRLDDNYEWVSLFAHSSFYYHAFKAPNKPYTNVYDYEIDAINPKAGFYNLFACSTGDYGNRLKGSIAQHYVFSKSYGLCAIAPTKTGGMRRFKDFYRPLGNDASIGQAFMEWFSKNGEDGVGKYSRSWFYGMTIIGDPTLVPNMS
jgi:hypothetical protein